MNIKRSILGMLAILFVFTGLAYAKETVKIGLITPLTGDVKTYGESAKNSFYIALEEYGKSGKYQIIPLVADDRNDPTEGANGALKLITQDKVLAIVVPHLEGCHTGERVRGKI